VTYTERDLEARYTRASDVIDVILVEDHGLFRQGLCELLVQADPALHLVAAAKSAEEALEIIPTVAPDVVLMDIHLPGMSGVEAIRRLAVLAPATRVLVLSGSAEDHDILEALFAGARGYILKSAPVAEIAAGIRTAADGGSILSSPVASQLLDHVRQHAPPLSLASQPVGQLTPRETEVLRLVASGLSNREIAGSLVLSEHTVHRHIANILRKLAQSSRSAATAHAVRVGLI
jgi:DNA-binding NarL/FixJ family response regulator